MFQRFRFTAHGRNAAPHFAKGSGMASIGVGKLLGYRVNENLQFAMVVLNAETFGKTAEIVICIQSRIRHVVLKAARRWRSGAAAASAGGTSKSSVPRENRDLRSDAAQISSRPLENCSKHTVKI